MLVDFQRFWISLLCEDFRTFRATVLTLYRLSRGKIYIQTKLSFSKEDIMRVPQTVISGDLRISDATILSRLSDTHVFERSATVKCQEIVEIK